jgi:hypothetical protein
MWQLAELRGTMDAALGHSVAGVLYIALPQGAKFEDLNAVLELMSERLLAKI